MLFEKQNVRQYIAGFDLGDDFCQVSWLPGNGLNFPAEKEPETLPAAAGSRNYDIPAVLYKAPDANVFYAGMEAAQKAVEADGTYIPKLLSLVRSGQSVTAGAASYEPEALLALYISRVLARLSQAVPDGKPAALMFTSARMDAGLIEALEKVKKRLDLDCAVFYEDHAASFYNFMLMQPKEIREPGSLLVNYKAGGQMDMHLLSFNPHTTPVVASYTMDLTVPGLYGRTGEEKDEEFCRLLHEQTKERKFASTYLCGSGFEGDWMLRRSAAYLCANSRRAFKGSGLCSKGAVLGGLFKLSPPPQCKEYFFLDDAKLSANICIQAGKRGEPGLYTLVEAGVNWYEVDKICDLVIEDSAELHLTLQPLTGGKAQDYLIRLEGMPMREGRTARIRLHFTMTSKEQMKVQIEDLGFGEIFPSSGLRFEQMITIRPQ